LYIYSVIAKERVFVKKIEFFQKKKKKRVTHVNPYTPIIYYIYRYESQKKIHKE
jgi:hypothetical protein